MVLEPAVQDMGALMRLQLVAAGERHGLVKAERVGYDFARWPADWWQALKEAMYRRLPIPARVQDRWPVKWEKRSWPTYTSETFDLWELFPEIPVGPSGKPRVVFLGELPQR
jgi:hypothetical protein